MCETPTFVADNSLTADITADLIDVGEGVEESDYAGKDVGGKVVLACGWYYGTVKLEDIEALFKTAEKEKAVEIISRQGRMACSPGRFLEFASRDLDFLLVLRPAFLSTRRQLMQKVSSCGPGELKVLH